MTTEKKTFTELALRAVALLGLIAILLLGAWGIIQIALYIPTLFEKFGNSAKTEVPASVEAPSLIVTAPASTISGSEVNVSWNQIPGESTYAYPVSYSCASGLSFAAPTPTGALEKVPCDTQFNFTNSKDSMRLVPTLTGTTKATTTLKVFAHRLSDNAIVQMGMVDVAIIPKNTTNTRAAVTPVKKPTVSNTSTVRPAAKPATTRYGLPDLSVHIISVTPVNNQNSVRFYVANVGTNTAGAGWTFNANLPTPGGYTYASAAQPALTPGSSIVYTLNFDRNNTGGYPGYYYPGQSYTGAYTNVCGYNQTYTYNGYANYPTASYGCNPAYITPSYNYNTYGYNTSNSNIVSVTADPNNYLSEQSESNNTASANVASY